MEPINYWQEYVGPESPLEFMGRYDSDEPDRCVAKYISRLPRIYGIVRRQSWGDTFAQEDQLRKEAVASELTAHLEATREDWEPALEAYRNSRPQRAESVDLAPEEIPVVYDEPAEDDAPNEDIVADDDGGEQSSGPDSEPRSDSSEEE